MATRTRRRAPQQSSRSVSESLGPFEGVFDTDDPNGADWTKYLNFAVNMWTRPGATGMETRPAKTRIQSALGLCRGIYQFAKSDGTKFPIGIFGQTVIRLDTGAVMTPTVTIIAAGTGTVCAVMYNDEMIFNDGVNAPFRWNGVAASAGVAIAFNVGTGVAYGMPWVYLAKLFFIRADARLQFVWSEEDQAGVGYQQVNYANFWNFQQSSTEPLCGGEGTNDGMYIFRARSVAYVTGAVTANFATTGTFDGVSDHIGCPCPTAKIRVAQTVYFLDMFGRLHCAGPDPNVRALYEPARIECSNWGVSLGDGTAAATALPPCQLVYWEDGDVLLHQRPTAALAAADYILAWQRSTEKYLGRWQDGGTVAFNYSLITSSTDVPMQTIGICYDGSNRAVFLSDASGNVDRMNIVGTQSTSLPNSDASGAIATVETTGWLLNDDRVSKLFERLTWIGESTNPVAGTGFHFKSFWMTNLGSAAGTGGPFIGTTNVPPKAAGNPSIQRIGYGPLSASGRFFRWKLVGGYDAQNGNVQGWHKTLGINVDGTVELVEYTQDAPSLSNTFNGFGTFFQ